MQNHIPVDSLEILINVLKQPTPPPPNFKSLTSYDLALLHKEVITFVDFEDLVCSTEFRGSYRLSSPIKELAKYLEIPIRYFFHKPRFLNSEVMGHQGFSAIDAVGLLISLESLGFCVKPEKLVGRLARTLQNKELLTDSEISILQYTQQRNRQKYTLRSNTENKHHLWAEERFKNENGYRFKITLVDNKPLKLEVTGPKYKKPKPRISLTCEYCGFFYTKGDMESSINHRHEHAKLKRILEPRPSTKFARRLINHQTPELVNNQSPLWMHQEVYERALRFKREFQYDFVQWDGSITRKANPNCEGYLFSQRQEDAPTGTIVGACAFILRKGQWTLYWIWVAPGMRRHGVLSSRWANFLVRYGDFDIEWPLSDAMKSFVRKAGTTSQKAHLVDEDTIVGDDESIC
ncbi:hypothetical protein HZF02_20025 [Pseudomonas yamanorum]|nr:hypothetical protein HZF02_10605 [Pseudomonas yamanorum]QLG94093.1 hypothetical protein HZF02_20025 [Pseudomonas yamanorum]